MWCCLTCDGGVSTNAQVTFQGNHARNIKDNNLLGVTTDSPAKGALC